MATKRTDKPRKHILRGRTDDEGIRKFEQACKRFGVNASEMIHRLVHGIKDPQVKKDHTT